MTKPLQVINILSQVTQAARKASIDCPACRGQGEIMVYHPETGHDTAECPECLGSGYNTLGLIVKQIVKPPQDGYGPVELRQALNEAQNKQQSQ